MVSRADNEVMLHINQIKPQKKKNKYGAKATVVDGIRFHSAKEARRYGELILMERAGLISGLELQPQYDLRVNGLLICRYRADFRYEEKGYLIVEDVKGLRTELYKLKCKMMKAIHNIDIRET